MSFQCFRRYAILVFFLLICISAHSGRAIPDNNLGYPVLVTLSGSSGSGFFLATDKFLYLVTAKHVIFQQPHFQNLIASSAEFLSFSGNPDDKNVNKVSVDLGQLFTSGQIASSPKFDVAIVRIGSHSNLIASGPYQEAFFQGVRQISAAEHGLLCSGMQTIKRFDSVLTANEVYVFGYPSSIGLQEIPQVEFFRPLIKKGIVSGKNFSQKTIILDCMTFFGNSGGPVLEVESDTFKKEFKIIGVVSQYIPFSETWINSRNGIQHLFLSNSGYSVVAPIDAALELIEKFEKP